MAEQTTDVPKKSEPNRSKLWRFLPPAIILIGLLVTILYGLRAMRSFRQVQYIQQQGLDRGTASVDAIQPWMTIRFIAVAYAVPEEYLYSALDVAFDRRNADRPIGRIELDRPTPTDGPPPTPIPDFGTVIVERANWIAGSSGYRPLGFVAYAAAGYWPMAGWAISSAVSGKRSAHLSAISAVFSWGWFCW